MLALLLGLGSLPLGAAGAQDELKNTDPERYYILLDLNNQIVTVFERDEAGEYTRIVRRFLCTSGRTEVDPEDPEDAGTPTPRGVWKIGGRERFGKFANFGSEYARYWTQIVGSVFFHSIMFGDRSVNSLKRSAFSNLGNNVSHGCVRLYVEDAKWLYYYACPGTTVEVSTDEPQNRALKKALKSELSFSEYNSLQKGFYDGEELPNDRAWVTVSGARLRKGSGTNFDTVMRLDVGTELEVLMKGEAWVKVRADRREGYVKRGYISYIEGEMDTREDATLMKGTDWLYAEPNAGSERVVKVPTDVSVRVLERLDGGWTRIAYWNETGYVKSSRLTSGWGEDMEAERPDA
ncbi:MAG: SH3 domain-containing protein [Clostridia bacterium]|nr:SH3 domain-containing protein [Clostridia bacterium]